jgi:hypothetical protein
MRPPSWMLRTRLGRFLLLLPVYAGVMLPVTAVYHLLSGKKIDWFFVVGWGLFTAAVNALVPATKWRPRLNRWE